jgi:lipopolysaccharide transport system ATP-binding protein
VRCFDSTNNAISLYTSTQARHTVHTNEVVAGKPTVTRVELVTSENGSVHGFGLPLSLDFEIEMPEGDLTNMALSIQVFNHLNFPVLYNWVFDIDTPILRKNGTNKISLQYPELSLYKGNYYIRVHLAETKQKSKFQEFDCCPFEVEMLNRKEPEWGWQDGVCQYFDKANWNVGEKTVKVQDSKQI